MVLDRELQNKILIESAEHYPSSLYLGGDTELADIDEKVLAANLQYLEESGLIHSGSVTIGLDNYISFGPIKINNWGLDFLQSDGGISAILKVVTVRFEADTLSAILTAKINQSDLPDDEKSELVEAVKELPAEGMKYLMTKVLDKGIENIPKLVQIISSTLDNIPS